MLVGNKKVGKTSLKTRLFASQDENKNKKACIDLQKRNKYNKSPFFDIEIWDDPGIYFSVWDFVGNYFLNLYLLIYF